MCQNEEVPLIESPLILSEITDEKLLIEEWRRQYQAVIESPPLADDCVYAMPSPSGESRRICLEIQLQVGRPPFIFTRAYVPMGIGIQPAWYAQAVGDQPCAYGFKIIMAARSRNDILRRCGIAMPTASVRCIRILRASKSGDSLIGEVAEW